MMGDRKMGRGEEILDMPVAYQVGIEV
jgi:hypothetical protein